MNISETVRIAAVALALSCAGWARAASSTVYVDKSADAASADGTRRIGMASTTRGSSHTTGGRRKTRSTSIRRTGIPSRSCILSVRG